VGKLATVEHSRLTGENACLTQVVRCLISFSQERDLWLQGSARVDRRKRLSHFGSRCVMLYS
jgi:hypothetical protein